MIYAFDGELAMKVGVDAAILLHHIEWWIAKNKVNEINYHDGCYWTYNSASAYSALFPFWSSKKIQRELKKLEDEGYVKTGCYNKDPMDRTKWYTLGDKLTTAIAHGCPIDCSGMSSRVLKNEKTTIDSKERNSREHSNNATRVAVDVPPALADVFAAFEEHRKQMRKPLTEYAKKLILRKLDKLAQTDEQKRAILEQSISRGWLDVFPISNGGYRQQGGQQSARDMADQAIAMMRESGWLNDGTGKDNDSADAGGVPSWVSEQQGRP